MRRYGWTVFLCEVGITLSLLTCLWTSGDSVVLAASVIGLTFLNVLTFVIPKLTETKE